MSYQKFIDMGLLSPTSRSDAAWMGLANLGAQLMNRGAPRLSPTPPPIDLNSVMQTYQNAMQGDLQRGLALRQFERSDAISKMLAPVMRPVTENVLTNVDQDGADIIEQRTTMQQTPSPLMQTLPAALRPYVAALDKAGQGPAAISAILAASVKPDGKFRNVVIDGKPMVATNAQIRQAQASGRTVEPYSAPSTSINLNQNSMVGKPPPGYAFVQDPNSPGGVVAVAIPGSPAAKAQAAATEKKGRRKEEVKKKVDIVLDSIGTALTQIGPTTTGLIGDVLKNIGGTAAKDLKSTLSTIQANIGFDALQTMRNNSPTGGALGQVSEGERAALEATFGNVEQSQTAEQLRRNLIRLNNQFLDTIHGEDNGPPRLTITAESDSLLPQGIPAGSVAIGRNANGNVVYQTLTGKRLVAD